MFILFSIRLAYIFGKYRRRKIIQSLKPVDTCKTKHFSCKFKSVQTLKVPLFLASKYFCHHKNGICPSNFRNEMKFLDSIYAFYKVISKLSTRGYNGINIQ